MAAGHRIGVHRVALAATVLAGALVAPASAARHGTRAATGGPVRVTSAAVDSGSAHARPHRTLVARRGALTRRANPAAPAGPEGAAVTAGPDIAFSSPLNFAGPTLADSASFPPDTQGAVGPSQFLVAINGRFRSYSKTTGLPDGALNADPDVFFGSVMSAKPPGGVVFTSDPHVRYDRLSQRWFIVMIDAPLDSSDNATVANRILVAVSDGPDLTPSTVWTLHFIQVSGVFADYPTLGVDANALYVGTNDFSLTGSEPYAGTDGYVIKKSSVASGTLIATKLPQVTTAAGPGVYTPQGVDNPDPGATEGYFVGVDNQVFSKLDVVRISNPGSNAPTASAPLGVTVPTTRSPINVPNLGGSLALDALDDRLFAASMRDDKIWTAHNIAVNSSGNATGASSRDGSRWYELDVSGTPSLVQSGTVFDTASSSPLSYWIPTVAVSGQGHMAIGGSVSGAAHHPDAWFSGRLAGDPAGATDVPTVYTSSTANYNPGNNRWGDYSAVSLDPNDDMTLWTIQEHVAAPDTWGTRIAKLRAPAPAIPASVSPRALTGQASVGVTLTGATTGGRGFFDPGPGFTRPSVAAGCGVDVTAVAVDSPSQATLTLDTTAATNAACSVTFTNPDGQIASAAIKLLERPPVATDDSASVAQGAVLNGASVLTNDSDPDGDALTASKASDPAHGAVTVSSDGTFTYTPAPGYVGPDSFTYTASDGALTDSATVSITVTAATDHAPVAVDDSASVAQDGVLDGSSVLANDTDADGDALTAAKASDPAHGAVTVSSDGTFTYTPATGYVGPDSFTYTASDGSLTDSAAVSISVTHVNHAPVANGDAYAVAQDTTLNGSSLLANDSDPDGDALTAAKASNPSHGTVTVNPNGTFIYTPSAGYSGPDSFTYTAGDGALQDTGAVAIAVTPKPVLPDLSNPGAPPANPISQPSTTTKLTLRLKKLKKRHGKLRLRASGAGPANAAVRVVLFRGRKRVVGRTVTIAADRWRVVFRFRRHGHYRVVAKSGLQRVSARKRV